MSSFYKGSIRLWIHDLSSVLFPSQIETEKLLAHLVEAEMSKRLVCSKVALSFVHLFFILVISYSFYTLAFGLLMPSSVQFVNASPLFILLISCPITWEVYLKAKDKSTFLSNLGPISTRSMNRPFTTRAEA